MSKKNPELYNSDLIDDVLDSISPVEAKKIEKKMLIAAKIDDAIKAKNWKNKDLLRALGKNNPSVITKWLSGTHNFTIDTLVELEHSLGISLLDVEEKRDQIVVKYHIEVSEMVALNPDPTDFNEIIRNSKKTRRICFTGISFSGSNNQNFAKA